MKNRENHGLPCQTEWPPINIPQLLPSTLSATKQRKQKDESQKNRECDAKIRGGRRRSRKEKLSLQLFQKQRYPWILLAFICSFTATISMSSSRQTKNQLHGYGDDEDGLWILDRCDDVISSC